MVGEACLVSKVGLCNGFASNIMEGLSVGV